MPPQLVALTEGPNILLDKPILLLGRHQECDIQLASRKVSRRHCCIAQVTDYLVVRDLCSTNGIRINGVRVNEGALKEGDELTIGNHRYQVLWNAPAGEPVPPRVLAAAPPVISGKEAVRRTRHVPYEEDEQLESADEPVALDEPDSPAGLKRRVLSSAPVQPPARGAAPARGANSFVLPENLALAPLSEAQQAPANEPDSPPPQNPAKDNDQGK